MRPWDPTARGQQPQPPDLSAERHRVPSSDTTGRLLRAVGGELDRLRSEVSEEFVLVRLLLNAGHAEAAKRLMDEQSARLRHFQDHVEAAIASAVVERTAEEILAEAAQTPESPDVSAQPVEGERGTALVHPGTAASEGTPRTRLRLLVAAVSLIVLAVFVAGGPLPGNLYELVSERLNGPSHSQREAGRTGGDRNATVDDDSASEAEEAPSAPADSALGDPSQAPEILLLLGRLARLADDSRGAPVAALLDVDRLVARLVTEVAPLLAPLPSDASGGEAAPTRRQAPPPNAAPQPQANSEPQPPAVGEPGNQPQPAEQSPPPAPLFGNPPAPPGQGTEGESLEEHWRRQREQGESAPQPANSSEFPDDLGARP